MLNWESDVVMKQVSKALALAVLLNLAVSSTATADTAIAEDPKDTGDVMDLDIAAHGHGDNSRVLVHTISTYDAWSDDEFIRAEIRFWLADGDPSPDRVLVITRSDGSFDGTMYTAGARGDLGSVRGTAKVSRSGERTLIMRFRQKVIKRDLRKYRWKAYLYYPCSRDPDAPPCAPPPPDTHSGKVVHRLSR